MIENETSIQYDPSEDRLDEELAYEKKNQVSSVVQKCIFELFERFWILKETDEKLFFQIKDNEAELKRYFRETFRYRLVSTHELIKLEKIPVTPRTWMGDKVNSGTTVFKSSKDYYFFFLILAFLEGKKDDEQISLQNICEYLQFQEEGELTWKDGAGYQNRLSLVRVMKYIVKMNLIKVIDEDLDNFSGNYEHDVLMQRTIYISYFTRVFQQDVTEWQTLDNFLSYLEFENAEPTIERKHKYYRRLFLEPIIYHSDLSEAENDYVKNYYPTIESHLYRYYEYAYERYQFSSMLVKSERGMGEQLYPADNMVGKVVMLCATYVFENRMMYPINEKSEIEITDTEFKQIISEVKEQHRTLWTKAMKQASIEQIKSDVVNEMKKWDFVEETSGGNWKIKEGLFRFMGDYF